jgi:hypothetical protein
VWGGDADISHEDDTFAIETNLHCPACKSEYVIYYPKEEVKSNGEVVANMGQESR